MKHSHLTHNGKRYHIGQAVKLFGKGDATITGCHPGHTKRDDLLTLEIAATGERVVVSPEKVEAVR